MTTKLKYYIIKVTNAFGDQKHFIIKGIRKPGKRQMLAIAFHPDPIPKCALEFTDVEIVGITNEIKKV